MTKKEMYDYSRLATLTLNSLNEHCIPMGAASGCYVIYKDKKLIFTVSHAISDGNPWYIKSEIVGDKQKYIKGSFYYANFLTLNLDEMAKQNPDPNLIHSGPTDIDFGVAEFPENERILAYLPNEEKTLAEVYEYNGINFDFSTTPQKDDSLFFWGETRIELDPVNHLYNSQEKFVTDMKYVGEYPYDKNLYLFQLPSVINDPDDYKGTSGAPIFNQKGELVSLSVGVIKGTPYSVGINLQKIKVIVDTSFNLLSK